MRFKTKLKICLLKNYLDTGMALTNYFKYVIAFFGVSSSNVKITLLLAFIYPIFSFFLGYWWLKSGFYKASIEVQNKYNLFVEEVRKKVIRYTD